jgi:hypothetical protein
MNKYNNISVFKNNKRTKDSQPLYNVKVEMTDGTKWEGGLWLKTSANGLEYLNGTLNPPYDGAAEQRRPQRPQPAKQGGFNDIDDDIPFEPAKGKAVDW